MYNLQFGYIIDRHLIGDNFEFRLTMPCKVTVMGTPAEEDGGGKVDLILAGAFEDMDLVFMAHPAQQDVAFLPCVSIIE